MAKGQVYEIQAVPIGVHGEPASNGGTRYIAEFNDGNTYSWFRNTALYNKVYSLLNQPVTARIEAVPKRDDPNDFWFNLVDVVAAGQQLPPQAMPAAQGTPAMPAAPMAPQLPGPMPGMQPVAGMPGLNGPSAPTPQPRPRGGGGMTEEDKARITRLAASGTAFDFISRLYEGGGAESVAEAFEAARGLTESILNHGWTGSFDTQPSAPSTPQEVAAQVNQVAGEGTVASGADLPWDNPQQ